MLKQLTRRTADLSSVLLKILTDAETTVFQACLKEIAIYFSLDPRRVSFHSLWVVGASALAAAGVPDYIILDMGRWRRSLAFLKYVRRTTKMFEVVRYTVSRIDMITFDKIWLKHAGRSL
jgi:hypothetical protein